MAEWIVPVALRVTAKTADEADQKVANTFMAMGKDRVIHPGVELDSMIDTETYPATD